MQRSRSQKKAARANNQPSFSTKKNMLPLNIVMQVSCSSISSAQILPLNFYHVSNFAAQFYPCHCLFGPGLGLFSSLIRTMVISHLRTGNCAKLNLCIFGFGVSNYIKVLNSNIKNVAVTGIVTSF